MGLVLRHLLRCWTLPTPALAQFLNACQPSSALLGALQQLQLLQLMSGVPAPSALLPAAAARSFADRPADRRQVPSTSGNAPIQGDRAAPPRTWRANEDIPAGLVRLQSADEAGGTAPSRLLHRDEALALARQQGLDLVQPPGGDRSDAPLVVIGSLKKLRLEARRGEEEAERQRRALARESVPKEVQFSTRISDNDMETKMRKVTELLAKGLRVQLTVLTKGAGEAAALKALDYLVTRLKAVAAPHGGVSKSGKACSQVVARLPPAN